MKNTWSTRSSLTNKELECINNISSLFNQPLYIDEEENKLDLIHVKPVTQVKENLKRKNTAEEELDMLIKDAQNILNDLEKKGKNNIELVQQIETDKGQVLANTKDFQQSCVSILNRDKMISKVAREIERYLQHYKNYDECYFILNHQEVTEDPKELLSILNKIQQGVTFFKKNNDFQKAEVFLKRFEKLKEHALEKINNKVQKILFDVNAEINLRVENSNVFEKATDIDQLQNVNQILYLKPKPEKLFDVIKLFFETIEERYRGMGEYFEFLAKIYDQYFDYRRDLLDKYMTCFLLILNQQNLTLDQYIISFLQTFGNLLCKEQEYYLLQFSQVPKFSMFKRDYEFEIITKYIKPKVRECQDFTLLCQAIDQAKNDEMAKTVNQETCQELFLELEHKLQILFFKKIQDIFHNTNLLNIQQFDQQNFPLDFIEQLNNLLQDLKTRVERSNYLGLMLEVVQRILADHLQPFMEYHSGEVEALIIVIANLMFIQQNLLEKPTRKSVLEESKNMVTESLQESSTNENTKETPTNKQQLDSELAFDDILQQPSFMESIWQYVTETTAQYTSIFSFIEESIPKLKNIQMDDMYKIFDSRIQQCKKRLFKNFVKESLRDLKQFQQSLKVDFRNMTQSEKEALFRSQVGDIQIDNKYRKYALSSVTELYQQALVHLSQTYVEFNRKTQSMTDKLGVEGAVIVAQMKDELRMKCLNYFQKFQQFLSQYYDKTQYEEIGIKSGRELLSEVFGIKN